MMLAILLGMFAEKPVSPRFEDILKCANLKFDYA
jgi:hypothetical protein